MKTEDCLPCRNHGGPSDDLVERVIRLLGDSLPLQETLLREHGLTPEEYDRALVAAIERIRGRNAASNQERRRFVTSVIGLVVATTPGLKYDAPEYGKDTVHRLTFSDGLSVALIQKGCPDGKHTVEWDRPAWADELYVWWVCDGLTSQPGEHVWKGVGRLRRKTHEFGADQLDGVIFFDSSCGTPVRPCPRGDRIEWEGRALPPPCVFVFPHYDESESDLNWNQSLERKFPGRFLMAFGLAQHQVASHVGSVGFKGFGKRVATEITARFGQFKSTQARK